MVGNALRVHPRFAIFPLSAWSGQGLDAWYGRLRDALAGVRALA